MGYPILVVYQHLYIESGSRTMEIEIKPDITGGYAWLLLHKENTLLVYKMQ